MPTASAAARRFARVQQVVRERITEARLRTDVLAALERLRRSTSVAELERIFTRQDAHGLHEVVERLRPYLGKAEATVAGAFLQGARTGNAQLGYRARFDVLDAHMLQAARAHAGALVTGPAGIVAQTRAAVNAVITRTFQIGMTARDTAKAVYPVVGLTERWARAVELQRVRDIANGMSRDAALAKAERSADRLRKARAKMIARTEIVRAEVAGQLEAWRRARETGLLAAGAQKVWITTDDEITCSECVPLDGEAVPLEAEFPGGVDGPPLHPNCRCAIAVRPPESAAFAATRARIAAELRAVPPSRRAAAAAPPEVTVPVPAVEAPAPPIAPVLPPVAPPPPEPLVAMLDDLGAAAKRAVVHFGSEPTDAMRAQLLAVFESKRRAFLPLVKARLGERFTIYRVPVAGEAAGGVKSFALTPEGAADLSRRSRLFGAEAGRVQTLRILYADVVAVGDPTVGELLVKTRTRGVPAAVRAKAPAVVARPSPVVEAPPFTPGVRQAPPEAFVRQAFASVSREADRLSSEEVERLMAARRNAHAATLARNVDRWVQSEGWTAEERAAVERKIQELIDKASVVTNVDRDIFEQVLKDGRFKSQFETHTSHGSLDPHYRAGKEYHMFSIPDDVRWTPEQRPIYGSLATDPASGGYRGASGYGEITVRFKDGIRARVTGCGYDSFGSSAETGPMRITHADLAMLDFYKRAAEHILGAERIERLATSYFEIQVHGGATVADIAEVLFPRSRPPSATTIAMLGARHIPWKLVEEGW